MRKEVKGLVSNPMSRRPNPRQLWLYGAIRAAQTTQDLIRRTGRGKGDALPGRVMLTLAPFALSEASSLVTSVLVSGTNGKTTTTAMIRSVLGGDEVLSNDGGANMDFGVAAAFLGRVKKLDDLQCRPQGSSFAVFEVDEAYLGSVARALKASVVVLLNLSRDQLDRNAEVRSLASGWRRGLQQLPRDGVTVVANCDDPLVVFSVQGIQSVVWVGGGANWRGDAVACPNCQGEIHYEGSLWWCECGLRRPDPHFDLGGSTAMREGVSLGELSLSVPGSFNLRNALFALATFEVLHGTEEAIASMPKLLERVGDVGAIGGRYQTVSTRNPSGEVTMYLAKNPAGWFEMVTMFNEAKRDKKSPSNLVLGLNAEIADGTDPSWIWDVPFEQLRLPSTSTVIITGKRALDLSVRVSFAGIGVVVEPDQKKAIDLAVRRDPQSKVTYLGNYTAFQSLRRDLGVIEGASGSEGGRKS